MNGPSSDKEHQTGHLRPIGRVHIVGIGGIGMSGIAETMHALGYSVQGSDLTDNANVKRLREKGIKVFIGQQGENVVDADVVTISSAVKADNPEVVAARERAIPVVKRAEMLAELMRLKPCITIAGTHGKTTTTSLVAAVLDGGALDPTVINGGIINAYGTNARPGLGQWMVVEADESDGTFVRLPSTIAIVTNIDPEHLEHYGDFAALQLAFRTYIENLPFYGVGIVCLDHPQVQALVGQVSDRRLVTYGVNEQADLRAVNNRSTDIGQVFDVEMRDKKTDNVVHLRDVALPMAGHHNMLNALAAIAVGLELSIPIEQIKAGLAGFAGVKRRFTLVGSFAEARVIDDYAHHPGEIAAALSSARSVSKGRVIAVVQPHRYSRLRDLFAAFCSCFNDADQVLVLPVYAAGESPLAGYEATDLARGLKTHGHRHVTFVEAPEQLADSLSKIVEADDLIICMGAGSISQMAYDLAAPDSDKTGGQA